MFRERLKELRKRHRVSQQRLGELLGVSAVAVGKWERGQTQPDITTQTRLADIFGTTIDDLCGHTAPEAPAEDGSIRIMTRAFRQLTPEEQEKYIAVGRALFAHAFDAAEKRQP